MNVLCVCVCYLYYEKNMEKVSFVLYCIMMCHCSTNVFHSVDYIYMFSMLDDAVRFSVE